MLGDRDMNGFYGLMRYAEQRGDGLLPELRDLVTREARIAAQTNVIDFLTVTGQPMQAGPNPTGSLPEDLPDNVIRFRLPVPAKPNRDIASTGRAPRKSSAPRLINRKS
jgi:hypothetical protein